MKKILKKNIVEPFLKNLASLMLKKHKPEIIAVTGSLGKTSTVQAIFLILSKNFSTSVPKKSYNTEIGAPLVVFDQQIPHPTTSIFKWFVVFKNCLLKIIFQKKYYQKLILEIGADKPGDIRYFTSFIKPHVAVITAVAPVHLSEFKNIDDILKEKQILIENLSSDDFAVLNYDDARVRKMADNTSGKVIFFGLNKKADIYASNIIFQIDGLTFTLNYQGKSTFVKMPNIISKHQIYTFLAAASVSLVFGFNLQDISQILQKIKLPPGRMNLLKGIKNSLIIDDSYNSNPQAACAALETLAGFKERRKIAALGTMNELSDFTEKGHRQVGRKAAGVVDLLIIVGKEAKKYLADEAKKSGLLSTSIFCFENSLEAGNFLKNKIKENDIILVKGSQNNVRMEWLTEQIMKNPEDASNLLVRQSQEWEKPEELKNIKN